MDFTPSSEEIDFATKNARLPASRLSLLVLLKTFQRLHRFPYPGEVTIAVIDHLRIQLRLGAGVAFINGAAVQRARQRNMIREYTGVKAWSKRAMWPWRPGTKRPW